MKRSIFGFALHVVSIALCAVNGFFLPLSRFPAVPWFVPLGAFAYGALIVILSSWVSLRRDNDANRPKPSWFSNPFSDLMHRTHLTGWGLTIFGLAAIMRAFVLGQQMSVQLLFFAFGVGILFGIEVSYSYFSSYYY